MNKETLRNLYRTKRAEIKLSERLRMDDLMLLQLQQINFTGISHILGYWPLEGEAEPDTHSFTGYFKHMLPDITVSYPLCNWQNNSMSAIAINDDTVFQKDKRGLWEPKEGQVIPAETLDLVLVPLLIYDSFGYRVGYGKGFYDRFLAACKPEVISIGFSYFNPVEKIMDTHQFDVPLTYCITPQRIYEF